MARVRDKAPLLLVAFLHRTEDPAGQQRDKEADAGKSADAVSRIVANAVENADDAVADVGDVASALSAAVVAKDGNDTAEALAGIVGAAAKTDDAVALASRAAAVVTAVTDDVPDLADAIAKALDADLAAAVKDASLSAEDAQKAKELYTAVYKVLRPDKFKEKEDQDKAGLAPAAADGDKEGDKEGGAEGGDTATEGGTEGGDTATEGGTEGGDTATEGGTEGGSEGGDTATEGGTEGGDTATEGGSEGGDTATEGGTEGGSEGGDTATEGGTDGGNPAADKTVPDQDNIPDSGLGNPADDINDNPYELHTTPTTLSGSGIYAPLPVPTPTTRPSRPVTPRTKPSPTPNGLR